MILTADWHLKRTPPRARTDDWLAAMEKKVRFILALAQKSPPLLIAGDLFDKARPGDFMERWLMDLIREFGIDGDDIIVVPGQHDLPYHSLKEAGDSGLGVLEAADRITMIADTGDHLLGFMSGCERNDMDIYGAAYGEKPPDKYWNPNRKMAVLLWHHMVINQPLWPGQIADKAQSILRKYKQFDLIVTGDNHQSFAIADESIPPRFIINPGSMMRLTAAQVNHKPCVYEWKDGRVRGILLPIEPDVLDLTQLEEDKERDERIAAFVERLGMEREMGLSYKKNLKRFFTENEVDPDVESLVWRCAEINKEENHSA